MKLSAAEVTIITTICGTAGGIPQTGTFLILANRAARTGGVFSQLRTRFAVVVFGRCSGQTSRGSGFSAHRTAIHKPATRVGFNLVMFLSVTAEAGLAILNITVGNTGIIISSTGVAAGAVSIVVRTSVIA